MKRWAFNILAGVSVAMFCASAGLWIRSYFIHDHFDLRVNRWNLYSDHGRIIFQRLPGRIFLYVGSSYVRVGPSIEFGFPGFSYRRSLTYTSRQDMQGSWHTTIIVQDAWIVTLTAAPPLFWLWWRRRLRQKRRRRLGLCGVCGYDLRAHSPGERCPECGTGVSMVKGVHNEPGQGPRTSTG